jgi:hypothetical protein
MDHKQRVKKETSASFYVLINNVEIGSRVSSGGQGKYHNISFPSPALETTMLIFTVGHFF